MVCGLLEYGKFTQMEVTMKTIFSVAVFAIILASTALAVPPPPTGAPEIDAGSAVGAFTLLSGAVMIIRSRRKV
jgi:hypothetical protein